MVKKLFLILTILFTSVIVIGINFQNKQIEKDEKEFPPIGKLYEVEGIKYHLYCTGTGSPTVILEAGWGESLLSWYPVQETLSRETQVCSYDRTGLGWSSGNNQLISNDGVAHNLHKLLQKAKISPPYIISGHSRGGIYVRNFYHHYSNEIQGMVLVDSAHEQGAFRTYKFNKTGYFKQKIQTIIAVPLARTGFIRIMGWLDADRQESPLPKKIIRAKTAIQNLTKTVQAATNEVLVMRQGLKSKPPAPKTLGDLPLIVITAGKTKIQNRLEEIEIEKLQKELIALSSNSKHVIAQDSGHYIMYDAPELIVTRIMSLIKGQ